MLQKWLCCDVDVVQLLLTNFSFLSDSGSGETHLGDTTFPIKLQHVKKNRELARVPFRVCAREGGAEMLRQSNAYLCLDS